MNMYFKKIQQHHLTCKIILVSYNVFCEFLIFLAPDTYLLAAQSFQNVAKKRMYFATLLANCL